MKIFRKSQAGYSLIEVLMAAGISVVVLIGVTAMLRDFTKEFLKAERKNVLVMIRTRVVNEITRKDSWVETYTNNTTFACLFLAVPDVNCGTGDTRFRVYDAGGNIVLDATGTSTNKGFTKSGTPCPSPGTAFYYPSVQCPIRLEVSWRLKNLGYNADMAGPNSYFNTFPTNMMPYGYFSSTMFPTWPVGTGEYRYAATQTAQIEVTGTFFVYSGVSSGQSQAENLANELQPGKYGFKLLKEVP